jgi:hypothetical protein
MTPRGNVKCQALAPKEVRGMRMIGLVVAVFALVAGDGWAQGSRPVHRGKLAGGEMGSTILDESVKAGGAGRREGPWVRAGERSPWRRDVARVEFLDAAGTVTKELKADGQRVMGLIPDEEGRAVALVEKGSGDGTGSRAMVRFYDATGTERWHAGVCCPISAFVDRWVVMAGNGTVVCILDVGEGERCAIGEDLIPAPPGCVGLRIFTAEGKLIHQATRAVEVSVSPRGKYVIYAVRWESDVIEAYQVDVPSGRVYRIPVPSGEYPGLGARDDGIVHYGSKSGRSRHRFVPGKGLEKLKD